MKTVILFLAGLLFCPILMAGQRPVGHPVPPGVRRADKLPNPADQAPPLVNSRSRRQVVDPAQLKRQAEELAKRAQLIPDEVAQVGSGRLPADLIEQLRKIEKLSKQLRRELAK